MDTFLHVSPVYLIRYGSIGSLCKNTTFDVLKLCCWHYTWHLPPKYRNGICARKAFFSRAFSLRVLSFFPFHFIHFRLERFFKSTHCTMYSHWFRSFVGWLLGIQKRVVMHSLSLPTVVNGFCECTFAFLLSLHSLSCRGGISFVYFKIHKIPFSAYTVRILQSSTSYWSWIADTRLMHAVRQLVQQLFSMIRFGVVIYCYLLDSLRVLGSHFCFGWVQ